MRSSLHFVGFALLAALLAFPLTAERAVASETTTVILVRHAEKTEPTADPPLSDAGRERARELARVLADAGIDAVYATPFIRTRDSATPIAKQLGLEVRIAPVEPEYGVGMAKTIRAHHRGETVLAVSHSNTVPGLIAALGYAREITIDESEYDDLFVLTLREGTAPQLLHLHYGAPSP